MPPVSAEKIKLDILEFLTERGEKGATFVDLHEEISGFTYPLWPVLNKAPTILAQNNKNALVWLGHSNEADQAIFSLINDGKAQSCTCSINAYKKSHFTPKGFPVAKSIQQEFEETCWLPSKLKIIN